jgi:CRP-like cAMP-binding protein
MCTAVALTASSIRTLKKDKMLHQIRANNKTLRSLLANLLSNIKTYRDHVADLLTSTAEQRLAYVLVRLAHLGKNGRRGVKIPHQTDKVLAEMVGTTRSRINLFMNHFRKQGFIGCKDGIEVRPSLQKALGTR